MARDGSCVCGAVTYSITTEVAETGACHCGMCRKWSGGVFMSVAVPPGGMELEGAENLSVYGSSPWAERVFCKTCGSSLFYRVTAEGPMQGEMHVGLGTLADVSGIPFTGELYIDVKPDIYSFAGEGRHQMTEAQVIEMFSGGA
ncbi:GFA family protein [uncultured Tateyamaria sp.]|uniref:GFA family protein n=1 Tax=uncultured Tateyamaria sp. TaxID=455651 RepID=UPI002637704D|nr:GFA family protein [uncultured Tateyamaria sp.]